MKPMPLPRPDTLKDLAYKQIKEFLITGRLKLNVVYSATQLAEVLGVSRTPVREALLQLVSEGYLTSIKGRGFKVRNFSEKEIKDFFETRKIIEAHIISCLAEKLSEEDIRQLSEILDLMANKAHEKNFYAFLEADKEFHMMLVKRYNNLFLLSIMENIRNLISILGHRALSSAGRIYQVINEHKNILSALQRRDKNKAKEAIIYHLSTTEKYILKKL